MAITWLVRPSRLQHFAFFWLDLVPAFFVHSCSPVGLRSGHFGLRGQPRWLKFMDCIPVGMGASVTSGRQGTRHYVSRSTYGHPLNPYMGGFTANGGMVTPSNA